MEDISTLIWLGVAILWFVTRILRRGARKAAQSDKPPAGTPPSPPAGTPSRTPPTRIGRRPDDFGRDGSPPPIVPR